MEETPQFPASEDEDKDKGGATAKKKAPSLAELFKLDEDKEKAGADIASLLGFKKERPPAGDEDSAPDKLLDSDPAEKSAAEVNEGEESYIYSRIADNHLEYPVTDSDPLPPVTDYLGLVHDGQLPGPAYEDIIRDNGLETDKDAPKKEAKTALIEIEPDEEYTLPSPTTTSAPRPAASNREGVKKEERPAISASEIAAYVLGQRRGSKKTKEKLAQKQKKLEQKILHMESEMTAQEQSLQQLTREKRARERVVAPAERMQPGRSESRIGLTKPERAGHIGKVVINKEKTTRSAAKKREFSPEQVRTMRRHDLLVLSEKITVEGASLKHMFENNLFGEGALRRLVEAYLDGRELQPILRREILEKQIDYERDPLFRDRDHTLSRADTNIFARMLQVSEPKEPPKSSTAERKQPAKERPNNKAIKNVSQYASSSVTGTILAITIVVLIGLILYVIFE